ncbi:hypothetical protein Bca52824_070822 [Brassica carinata]|uniref:Uncharacterized protein n=1 Tax=Brassica carinata TaxID=52824 RepID=A0A8X7Q682_BRACI|nr:hypothetical protein Bca52824_070822 [Brassica carinata]
MSLTGGHNWESEETPVFSFGVDNKEGEKEKVATHEEKVGVMKSLTTRMVKVGAMKQVGAMRSFKLQKDQQP